MITRTIKTRTPEEDLLGIARASQKLGEVATARAALEKLSSFQLPAHLEGEFKRLSSLVDADYARESILGEGSLLDLDNLFVKERIRRGVYPSAVLEVARKARSVT
jgi:hypothetical protein